jgi:hypothetical protein
MIARHKTGCQDSWQRASKDGDASVIVLPKYHFLMLATKQGQGYFHD